MMEEFENQPISSANDNAAALEAAAEVSAEMGAMYGGNALPGSKGASLEQEFKLLEGSAAVDDELQKLCHCIFV